ncbi:hypothetical protein QS419_12375 [Staphylococcus pseudintermedius]|nr:hypothetical protein [Staphylococcus pseudintermedius]WMZ68187.1 hypothetical protein QS419_12375 [Staphylococcus pseudintermedius]
MLAPSLVGVPLFDALPFNESTVDTNVLAPSLVVLPFDASLLNELTADTNSLASVLTASPWLLDNSRTLNV